MTTQNYSLNQWGAIPSFINDIISKYNGLPATTDNFSRLDDDITFIVSDCGEAHGNIDQGVKIGGGWLCPRDGNNTWNIRIELS